MRRMRICIVHGGQTGVDRGAHDAALELGWDVTGWMPSDGRCEAGAIPAGVAAFLRPWQSASYLARTEANVAIADAVLICVADRTNLSTPGTRATAELALAHKLPCLTIDPIATAGDVAGWISGLRTRHRQLSLEGPREEEPLRLLVAGPRASRWPEGRATIARLLVAAASPLPIGSAT